MAFQDHLEFYLENRISPVRQDISDLQKHLERRSTLYRRLGVPARHITGNRVLEVGPGSGHNSLYLAACRPAALDLVEPNPVGRQGIEALYATFAIEHTAPRVIPQSLEEFEGPGDYDIVIAEAWLGSTPHELGMIGKLSRQVKQGGILILTLQSPVGMLANMLRRLLAYELITAATDIATRTSVLLEAFGPHLSTMCAMSRLHEDWIQDTLLNPAALTSVITPSILLSALDGYGVYETYPRFITDWRWYKELTGGNKSLNPALLDCWRQQSHNFLDAASPPTALELPDNGNARLEAASQRLIDYLIECESRNVRPDRTVALDTVESIADLLATASSPMGQAIIEFIDIYRKPVAIASEVAAMRTFGRVFGRELVYISFIRDE
jgi:hypothetical protein